MCSWGDAQHLCHVIHPYLLSDLHFYFLGKEFCLMWLWEGTVGQGSCVHGGSPGAITVSCASL